MHIPLSAAELHAFSFPSPTDDAIAVQNLGLADWDPLLAEHGLKFKNPQKLAIHYGIAQRKLILSLDKGAGKTLTYLSTFIFGGVKRFVILCSNNAKLTQQKHLDKYFPNVRYVFVEGQDKAKRKAIWERQDVDVFIATYATFQADMGGRTISKTTGKQTVGVIPQSVANLPKICDEAHKVLRRRQSKFFDLMKSIDNPWLILSSGSAGGKGPQDMWAMLHLTNRAMFRGYWPYVEKYTHVEETRFGKQISGVQNIEQWRWQVGHHTFHRRKDLKDYPPKTRQSLEVDMEPWQKKIHDQLRNELWAVWKDEQSGDDKMVITPNTLAATMKIRQFLVCPKLLDESFGWGAGLEGIWGDVEDAELKHYVISTPFRAAIPYIEQFLSAKGHGSTVFQGGMYATANELQSAIDRWTRQGGAAIQTIKFAESYELPAARIMYMLGYEYSAEENSQAEDRIHRDIRVTPHPVDIYYVKNRFSYEANLIDMMAEGADTNFAMMNRPLTEIFRRD